MQNEWLPETMVSNHLSAVNAASDASLDRWIAWDSMFAQPALKFFEP